MANITKRGKGYRIIVCGGYDVNGKRITHTMTWIPDPDMGIRAINKELSIVAADFEKKFKNGQSLDSKMRLSESNVRRRRSSRLHIHGIRGC